jgi:Tfp pilus assembly protein PilF
LKADPLSIPALPNLADALMRQGQGEESESQGRKAVLLVPDHPAVLQRLADTVSIRRPDESIRQYRRLIVLAPYSAAAQINLAESLSKRHGDDTSGPYYLAAMKLTPDVALIRFNYAMHLLCRGHIREG